MRRSRILLSLLSAFVLLAGACGGDDDNGDDGDGGGSAEAGDCPVDAFEDADGPVEVVVWHSYVGNIQSTLVKLAEQYNASQDKVKVSIESQGNSYEAQLRNFQSALSGGGNLPAITIGEDTNTQFMVDSGVVLPATACIEADDDPRADAEILPVIREAYTVDDIQYPASMNVSTIVLYYNKDHFRQAGLDPEKPPRTLEEVMEHSRALKAAGASPKPFVMKMEPWFLEHWVTGTGNELVDQNNGRDGLAEESRLDNDATAEAMAWVKAMRDEDLINAVPGTEGQIQHYFAMATNGSSMLVETSAAITTINSVLEGNVDPADLGGVSLPPGFEVKLDLGVALNPGLEEPGKGQVGGGAWYITNTGSPEVQSAAWDFVKFFNEVQNQVTWTMEGSYLPIVEGVKDDPALAADWTTTNRGKWLAVAYEGMQTLDPDFPGPVIGPYDKFRASVRRALESVGLQGTDPAAAIATAHDEIGRELTAYADSNF